MDSHQVLPPGQSPIDPAVQEIDAVAFALERLCTYLHWIEQHHTTFEADRILNLPNAQRELQFLAHATVEAQKHAKRLTELLLAGYAIDPAKRLPEGFPAPNLFRLV
jgi:hypothetical protein